MSDAVKPKRHWFLKAQLAVIVCVFCTWVIILVTTDVDSAKAAILEQVGKIWPNSTEVSDKAGQNSADFNEPHPAPLPNIEQVKDNRADAEPEIFGVVTGICFSKDKPSAVINDKTIVHEGDTINGVTIVKIYIDKVEFTKNGQSWTLNVRKFP
jgi:hypothetical protein